MASVFESGQSFRWPALPAQWTSWLEAHQGPQGTTDDRLVLTLMYHQGHDYTFEATRRS